MDRRVILILARKEIWSALRNRWFLLYAAGFAVLALALSRLSMGGEAAAGFAGFGRTAASLVNLVLLIVPLMGLTLGAASVAGEREQGTLATLLAQPISRRELLLGKYLGAAAALASSLALGFGLAGLWIAYEGGTVEAWAYGNVVGFATLLALGMLSIGFLISALAPGVGQANSTALILWLAFVFLGDLGLMGTAMTLRLDVGTLLGLTLLNPLETFKIAAVGAITGALDALGPAGNYAMRHFGASLVPSLTGILMLWILLPLLAALKAFDLRGIR